MTTFTGTISRTELSLGTLAIGTTTPYRVSMDEGLQAGTVTRRRTTASSPFVEDVVETNSVRDEAFIALTVYVTGTDLSTIQSNVQTLITALSQSTYTLTVITGGATYAWACRAADYSLRFDIIHSQGKQGTVVANIPRSPIATTGPI